MSIMHFASTSSSVSETAPSGSVLLTPQNVIQADGAGPYDSGASIRLTKDGQLQTAKYQNGGSFSYSDVIGNEWWTNRPETDIGASYEVKATLTGGTNPDVGTMDTWESLSAVRTWSIFKNDLGTESSSFLIQVRDSATMTVQDSATMTLTLDHT